MATRDEKSEAIIAELKQIVRNAVFARMSPGEIDGIEERLRTLSAIRGRSSSLNSALHYAARMKRPTADRYKLGHALKDAIRGL